ncbi:MAG: hypothetical protein JWR38_1960 [Mucilaginibacter sp.]|nr:hypothetical protein [Mucilaginibacter sp.]
MGIEEKARAVMALALPTTFLPPSYKTKSYTLFNLLIIKK